MVSIMHFKEEDRFCYTKQRPHFNPKDYHSDLCFGACLVQRCEDLDRSYMHAIVWGIDLSSE